MLRVKSGIHIRHRTLLGTDPHRRSDDVSVAALLALARGRCVAAVGLTAWATQKAMNGVLKAGSVSNRLATILASILAPLRWINLDRRCVDHEVKG